MSSAMKPPSALRLVVRHLAFCGLHRLRHAWSSPSQHIPRSSRKVSAAWLAANLEAADPAFVGKIERIEYGDIKPENLTLAVAKRLADALGVTMETLLELDN